MGANPFRMFQPVLGVIKSESDGYISMSDATNKSSKQIRNKPIEQNKITERISNSASSFFRITGINDEASKST